MNSGRLSARQRKREPNRELVAQATNKPKESRLFTLAENVQSEERNQQTKRDESEETGFIILFIIVSPCWATRIFPEINQEPLVYCLLPGRLHVALSNATKHKEKKNVYLSISAERSVAASIILATSISDKHWILCIRGDTRLLSYCLLHPTVDAIEIDRRLNRQYRAGQQHEHDFSIARLMTGVFLWLKIKTMRWKCFIHIA